MSPNERQRAKQALIWFALICFVVLVARRRIDRKERLAADLESRLVQARVAVRRINRNALTLEKNRTGVEADLKRAIAFVDALPAADTILARIDRLQATFPAESFRVESMSLRPDEEGPFALRRLELVFRGRYDALRRFLRDVETDPSLAAVVGRLHLSPPGEADGDELSGRVELSLRKGWSEAAAVAEARRKKP